jgi:hypothetical protein
MPATIGSVVSVANGDHVGCRSMLPSFVDVLGKSAAMATDGNATVMVQDAQTALDLMVANFYSAVRVGKSLTFVVISCRREWRNWQTH